jgi:hypothetical protein
MFCYQIEILSLSIWIDLIKQRDAALTKLNADSVALRKRLDEAIALLNKAGAR